MLYHLAGQLILPLLIEVKYVLSEDFFESIEILLFRLLPLEVQESADGIVVALFFTREQAGLDLSEGGTGTQVLNESL